VSFIDVTDVLLDPEVAGQLITVVRRQEQVNGFGQGVLVAETVPNVVASVTPVGDNSLTREVTFGTQNQAIRVITQYRLRGATTESATGRTFQPDLVLWHGDYYVVSTLNDFTQYGAGLVEAECVSVDYQEVAATLDATNVGWLDETKGRLI
jgi:hypothetical protein